MSSYVYGNTVRKQNYIEQPQQVERQQQERKVSQRVRANRNKALHMSRGYVGFLAIAAGVALFACVQYLQLQSEITTRSKHITVMQRELVNDREANTTKYNSIVNSMNLEQIRERAMNDLGMVYAKPEQKVEYKSPRSNEMTQYESIPKSGIVAVSEKAK